MTLYVVVFLLLLVFLFFSTFDKKHKAFNYKISLIILILIGGFRYGNGVDYFSYIRIYKDVNLGYTPFIEPTFKLLLKFVKRFDFNFQLVFLIYQCLTIFFISKYITYFTRYRLFAVFIFFTVPIFYFSSFNIIRQWLAVSLFGYALRFVVEKNKIKYFCIILLSVFIHKTAIFLIPFYFFINKKLGTKNYFSIGLGYFISLKFLAFLLQIFGFSAAYTTEILEEPESVNILVFPLTILFFIMTKVSFNFKNLVLNMLFLAILLMLTPLLNNNIPNIWVLRLTSYFTIVLLFALPNIIFSIKNKSLRYMVTFFVMVFCTLYFFRTLISLGEKYKLVPYDFNFNLFTP